MKLSNKTLFLLFFLAAFIPRILIQIFLPHHPNWDEVSLGFNAFSILKTAKDEWGIDLPLIFRAYGDYKLPVYIYLSLPFIAIFGLNPLSIRLLSIVAGSLLPIVFFLITKTLFPKNTKLPFLSALVGVLSTWSLFLSQSALEANLSLTIFLFSLYFLLQSKTVLSSLLFAINIFTYNSNRVILPFYLVALLFIHLRRRQPKNPWYHFLPLILAIIIFIYQSLDQSGQARFSWVTLVDSGAVNYINELRGQPILNSPILTRLLINKVTYFLYFASKNYLAHLLPQFLYVNGGSNYQFNIPNFYLIIPLLIPYTLLGLIALFKNLKSSKHLIFIYFLLLSPLPSAITRDAPHVLRSLVFISLISLTSVFGLTLLKRYLSLIGSLIFTAIILISPLIFIRNYQNYLADYSSSWQYGHSQFVSYLKQVYPQYDNIIITKKYGEPHEFILFYWPWDPQQYHQDNHKVWDYHASWYWVDAFDKFKFINDWEIKDKTQHLATKTLLITSPENYLPETFHLIRQIKFLDGSPAFDILSND